MRTTTQDIVEAWEEFDGGDVGTFFIEWDAKLEPQFKPDTEDDDYRTTLAIVEGDGDEYTDIVRLTFQNDWDQTLTRAHTVSHDQARHILAYLSETE